MSDYFDIGWFWAISEKGEVWARKNIGGEFEEMRKTRQAYLSKPAAEIAAPLIVERAALQARIAELEAMLSAKDEALRFYAKDTGYISSIAREALALTTSEAVEMMRKKDELIALFSWLEDNYYDLRSASFTIADTGDSDVCYQVWSHHMDKPKERLEGTGSTIKEAIETARAAGVEVKDVAL